MILPAPNVQQKHQLELHLVVEDSKELQKKYLCRDRTLGEMGLSLLSIASTRRRKSLYHSKDGKPLLNHTFDF